jgi:hypothetical protein
MAAQRIRCTEGECDRNARVNTEVAGGQRALGTVKKPLTVNRTRAVVENPEYAAFARRILKACARRIAAGDIESLALMAELADTIDSSIRDAVTGLREHGYSWAEIGSRLGVTRQAAQQRWGNRP